MYSLNFKFILLILTTVFALAQCEGKFTEVSEADGTCKSQFMIEVRQGIACKPRDTLVPLNPKPGQRFSPSVVSVSRCGGSTAENLICEPTNKTSIQIKRLPVLVATIGSKPKCGIVDVEEHIHCTPACRIKSNDCKTGQIYKKDFCKCECRDQSAQRNECEKMGTKKWNPENCQCVCQKEQECMNGMTWNKEFCECSAVKG